jgi:ribosomal protein S14
MNLRERCDGCGRSADRKTLTSFRPDGMLDVFTLCQICVRAVSASPVAAERERCSAIASHFQTAQGRTILRQIEEGAVVTRLRAGEPRAAMPAAGPTKKEQKP